MADYVLPLILLIPLVGAIICALLPNAAWAKGWALFVSLIVALLGVYLAVNFPYHLGGWQFSLMPGEDSWLNLASINSKFSLGVDAISLFLVLLTVLLMPLAIAASFASITDRPKQYYAWMLALTTAMLGVFVARDLLLFYIFFELTLIPMFFIIGIWGGPERRYAAAKFFLFTFAGSVFTLAAVVYLGMRAGNFDIGAVTYFATAAHEQCRTLLGRAGIIGGFLGEGAAVPGAHLAAAGAHGSADGGVSVILAGVLLKLGTYGLLRLAIPIGLITADTAWLPQSDCHHRRGLSDRHHLRSLGCLGAERHQKAGGLFLGFASGFLRAGIDGAERHRHAGIGAVHDQSRP
jgi:NADH-quinone oxidoreductase subunit M